MAFQPPPAYPTGEDSSGFVPPPSYPSGGESGPPTYPTVISGHGSQPPQQAPPSQSTQSKYFFLQSELNGLVLDIQGGEANPGTRVVTWDKKDPGDCDNQLWREDRASGTIRSKLSDLCLDIEGNALVINPFEQGKADQQWTVSGNRIQNRVDSNRVLDIAAANESPGARICAWQYSNQANQHWTLVYPDGRSASEDSGGQTGAGRGGPGQIRYFYLQSELHGKVLDIRAANREPGADVILWNQLPGADNQQWYMDHNGVIRSKMNGYALDSSDGNIKTQPVSEGSPNQAWTVRGNCISNTNDPNQVLDIAGANEEDGATVVAYSYHGGTNQHWKCI